VEESGVEEQTYLMLQAIVEPASQTVVRVNQELQNLAPSLQEFVRCQRQEGWKVMGIAPKGVYLLLILKRPLLYTSGPD
jgi:hypothetical protein